MVVLIEEDQKTLEYQKAINVDIENIANKKMFRRPIYEVIDNSFFAATKMLSTEISDKCKNNPNQPQNITSEVKVVLNKKDMEQWFIHKWL